MKALGDIGKGLVPWDEDRAIARCYPTPPGFYWSHPSQAVRKKAQWLNVTRLDAENEYPIR